MRPTITLNYVGVTSFINETIRLDRLSFRAHCEKLHGPSWRAQWGIGEVVRPEVKGLAELLRWR